MMPTYNEIIELFKKGSTLEAQEKITELRETALGLREENLALKDQLTQLQRSLSIQGNLVWKKPSYWLRSENIEDGPFCQRCYDADQKLMRLQGGQNDLWRCTDCKTSFTGPSYQHLT